MPLTPTDPTKPQVWITGQAPNQVLDFYIPQGPKGDPGGFNVPTVLTGTAANLNNVLTPGLYSAAGSDMTYLNNWPMQNTGGVLQVFQWSTTVGYVMQMFWPRGETSAAPNNKPGSRGVYTRTGAPGGLFSVWSYTAPSRIDQTAGRAMYQWDEINGREQLIYGSTGLRDISSMVDTTYYSMPGGVPSGYAAYIRRNGNNVHLSLRVTVVAANASGVVMFTLPTGFRADATVTAIGLLEGGTATPVACQVTPTGGFRVWHAAASGVLTVNLPFTSLDPWPTTLPGAYGGVIPNA
jgi:hypothetical protein